MKKDHSLDEAKKTDNKLLNRYRDVNPYDHSRVILSKPGYSYINASYIPVSYPTVVHDPVYLRCKTHIENKHHSLLHLFFSSFLFLV